LIEFCFSYLRIIQLRENCIYEHWLKNSINLKSFDSEIDETPDQTYEYNDLSLNQIRGVFYLIIFGIIYGILLIIFEKLCTTLQIIIKILYKYFDQINELCVKFKNNSTISYHY
jgi:hypothetical protein